MRSGLPSWLRSATTTLIAASQIGGDSVLDEGHWRCWRPEAAGPKERADDARSTVYFAEHRRYLVLTLLQARIARPSAANHGLATCRHMEGIPDASGFLSLI